jgi:hypothetical protein
MTSAPALAGARRVCSTRASARPVMASMRPLTRQGAADVKAFALSPRMGRLSRSSVAVRASDEMTYEIAPEGTKDYTPILGVVAFVAAIQGHLTITSALVLKGLATLQLLYAVSAVVTRKSGADTVSAVVGPAVLAVAALNLESITYMQTANALFGYYLCEKLEIVAQGSFWVWVATLGAAIYAGYGLEWYTAAFALWQASRLVRGGQSNKIPLLTIPAVGIAAWAFWKEHAQLLAVALFIAHTIASGLGLLEEVTAK